MVAHEFLLITQCLTKESYEVWFNGKGLQVPKTASLELQYTQRRTEDQESTTQAMSDQDRSILHSQLVSYLIEEICLVSDLAGRKWVVRLLVFACSMTFTVCCGRVPPHDTHMHFLLWLLRLLLVTALMADLTDEVAMSVFSLELQWACRNSRSSVAHKISSRSRM